MIFIPIESYDRYSAYKIANAISSCVVDSYIFCKHNPNNIKIYVQVDDRNSNIQKIDCKDLLKKRISSFSNKDSSKSAEEFIKVLFSNVNNLSDFSRISKIHNAAIVADNTNDSLLSLWSVMESLVEFDREIILDEHPNKEKGNKGNYRSKINNIINVIIPFIKSTYVEKLVKTCLEDLVRWDKGFFELYIRTIAFGESDVEKMFAFLAFESQEYNRKVLYEKTNDYPLLRYRIYRLNEQLRDIKNIKLIIKEHEKRVTWHLRRIYRARNHIIHDADSNNKLYNELVINLHDYLDTVISKAIFLINNVYYNESLSTVLNLHRLSVSIMDEKLNDKENEKITPRNGLRYLY